MSQHVIPLRTNYIVFAALLGLLVLTIAVAYIDWAAMLPEGFGLLGDAIAISIAMLIATTKAVLILMYFMHVRFSTKLVMIFSTGAFLWLVLLLVLGMADYLSRNVMPTLGK